MGTTEILITPNFAMKQASIMLLGKGFLFCDNVWGNQKPFNICLITDTFHNEEHISCTVYERL